MFLKGKKREWREWNAYRQISIVCLWIAFQTRGCVDMTKYHLMSLVGILKISWKIYFSDFLFNNTGSCQWWEDAKPISILRFQNLIYSKLNLFVSPKIVATEDLQKYVIYSHIYTCINNAKSLFQPKYCFVYAIKFSLNWFWFLRKNIICRKRKDEFSNGIQENSDFELEGTKIIYSTNIAKWS